MFWTAVAQVPPESVWAELGEPAPFDNARLERQFALAEPRSAAVAKSVANQGRATSQEPRKRVRVLDDRTSQLLAIAFNKLPPPEQLAMAVDTQDDFPDGVSQEGVVALHAAASEQCEVVEQLRQLGILELDIAQLDLPERYLWLLSSAPARVARIAGAALLLGPARELGDARIGVERVLACCRELRRSSLLRKCICTGLALGNCLNTGTARSNARAVVLPHSLLKLEELRGTRDDAGSGGETKAPSLLDFLVQALVDEAGAKHPTELRAEAEALLAMARAAKAVSLEEAEASCREASNAATKAIKGLAEVSLGAGGTLSMRVQQVFEEAGTTMGLVERAKGELAATQQWSSAKPKLTGEDWFGSWALFFEQLVAALARARAPASATARRRSLVRALWELATNQQPCQEKPCPGTDTRAPCAATAPAAPSRPQGTGAEGCQAQAPAPPRGLTELVASKAPTSKQRDILLDDDVRMEDLLKMRSQAALLGRAACQLSDKENVYT